MSSLILLHCSYGVGVPLSCCFAVHVVFADERLLNLSGAGRIDGLLAAQALGFTLFVGALRMTAGRSAVNAGGECG